MSTMDVLYNLVQERNERETFPFVAIHDSNAALWKEVDSWEHKCGQLEHQMIEKEEYLEKLASAAATNNRANNRVGADGESSHERIPDDMVLVELHYAESAALKNERKLMEELERLRDQVKTQEERHQKDVQDLKEANESQLELKEQISAQERNLTDLQEKYDNEERAPEQQERIIQHLKTQVGDYEQRANLAEQQCAALKDTIRILQEECETLKRRYLKFEQQSIKKEGSISVSTHRVAKSGLITKPTKKVEMGTGGVSDHGRRKIAPIVAAVVPSGPKQIIQAHRKEATCVRCDDGETQLLGTAASIDGTVRIWNRSDGSIIATLKAGNADFIISCDVANGLAAAGGNDNTCRVWDIKSQRMLHQLVGHQKIIVCVRFINDGLGVVTAAKDRQISIWDISKQTYRLLHNIFVNSSANSIDITNDSSTMVSGHTDGSLRLWNIQTGQGNAEIKNVHERAISSVQFHPFDSSKVLTHGMDSRIKIIDLASCKVLHEFSHKDFHTSYSWSDSVFSPDGAFVTAGSSSNGFIFVWNAENGKLLRVLKEGHDSAGVCGISWGREGLQSVDKKGQLILWS